LRRRLAGQPKEYQGRPKRIDQRKKHAEGDEKGIPERQGQSHWTKLSSPQLIKAWFKRATRFKPRAYSLHWGALS
jgi:hypothetical protein